MPENWNTTEYEVETCEDGCLRFSYTAEEESEHYVYVYKEGKIYIQNIKRLAGINRYETSLEIAKYIDTNLYNIENIVVQNVLKIIKR